MEVLELAKLGSQVVLDALVLFLIMRYLPNLHEQMFKEFREMHATMVAETNKIYGQVNRLVNLWIMQLDDEDKRRLKLSDGVFSDKKKKSADDDEED